MNNFKSKPNHEMGRSSATLTSPLSMTPDMHFLITVQCFYLVQYSTSYTCINIYAAIKYTWLLIKLNTHLLSVWKCKFDNMQMAKI